MTDLGEYCKTGNLKKIKYIVEELGCNLKVRNIPILIASGSGHLEVVKYLVEQGCDPTTQNNYAVLIASHNGYLDIIKYLVSQGCDPTAIGNRAIRMAVHNDHLDIVKYLLELGCDYETISNSIKYEVLQELRIKLLTVLNSKVENNYLKMEMLKIVLSLFTEYEIMSILCVNTIN